MKNHTEEQKKHTDKTINSAEVQNENKQTDKTKYSTKEDKMQHRLEQKENLKQYIFVIRELTGREIKRKYARSFLGVIWSVLSPLLHMLVISFVFSTMFKRDVNNFPIYYLCGNIFWSLFTLTTNSIMSCMVDNKGLLEKVKLPKQIFVVSRAYTALVNFGYSLIAFAFVLLYFRIVPTVQMLLFPVILLGAMLFNMGVGYVLAVLYVYFADVKHLYSVFISLLMYLCCLFYTIDRLPETLQAVVIKNPVYVPIYLTRELILGDCIPDFKWWLKLMLYGIVMFGIGFFVFKKNENKMMQAL